MICTIGQELSDVELALLFRDENDREAFEELVRRYENRLFMFIRTFGENDQMALDLSQETWQRVSTNIAAFGEPYDFENWLLQIARGRVVDHKRKEMTRREGGLRAFSMTDPDVQDDISEINNKWEIDPNAPEPIENLIRDEEIANVKNAMSAISPESRELLERLYHQGSGTAVYADELGVTQQTVRNRREVALEELTRALAIARRGKCPLPEELL